MSAPKPAGLSVATFNLRHNADDWERRAPLCVEGLAALHPHLIALQEVWVPIRQAQWLSEKLNEHLDLASPQKYVVVERPKWGFEEQKESVAILSRLPILESHGVDLPGGRVAISTVVPWKNARIEFISVHLHFGPPDSAHGVRRSQIRHLESWLEGRYAKEAVKGPAPLPIIAGDFNDAPESPAIALMTERYKSAYAAANAEEPPWTYGTPLAERNDRARGVGPFHTTLDYIFVPQSMEVRSAKVFCDKPSPADPDLYPSDHIGVLAEVDLGV